MALSDQQVLQWLQDNPNATDAQIAQAAAQAGVSAEQLSRVTSVPVAEIQARVAAAAPEVKLPSQASQIYLAGDSWLSNKSNTARIAEQTGKQVTNFAVGGSTTSDTLNQLNSFIASGGTFAPGTTVMLDIGGNDLLQGASPESVKSNLEKIVSTLGKSGVDVVLSGAPAVGSVSDVTSSTNLAMNNIFNDVASKNSNVTLVDAMSGLLNQKNLVDETGFHLNDAGQAAFNASLSNAYLKSQGLNPIQYSAQDIRDFAANNNLNLDQALKLAPYFSVSADSVRSAFAPNEISSSGQVSADQLSRVTGVSTGDIVARTAASLPYFTANPDVAAAYAENNYGMTPEQFAATHYQIFGANEQRAAPTEGVVSDAALKNWIDSNAGATTGQLYTAALNQGVGLDQIQRVSGLSTQDLLKEQILSTSDSSQWSGEGWGSAEKNAADMAKILESVGITNVLDLGVTSTDGGQTYYNKATGEAITMPSTYGERQTGNAFGGTFAGKGNTGYRVSLNEQGQPVFYTTGASSSDLGSIAPLLAIGGMIAAPWLSTQIGALTGLTGAGLSAATGATLGGATGLLTGGDLGDIAKGALLGGAGGYIGGSISEGLSGSDFAGTGSNLNMAQIESGLGTPGYGYNAGAASSGLFNPAVIGSGAYTQTSYPYDYADLAAADTLQLYGQVGANPAAIEQNLVATGVDPLVAADAANQVILNPSITQADLTNYLNTQYTGTGGIYDVNPAVTYPTSTLPGSGGLLNDVPGYVKPTTTTPTTPTTTTPSTSDLLKLATTLGTLNAAGNIGGGGGGAPVNPTQGVPVNNPAYYQAIQQYYNTYMPNQPADVATPLQQWYSGAYKA